MATRRLPRLDDSPLRSTHGSFIKLSSSGIQQKHGIAMKREFKVVSDKSMLLALNHTPLRVRYFR
jgi:hypothetical protein